ncbi:MAG: hypothetical protein SCARUB_05267, partial [Candidatus Scalindua rubra]
MRLCERLFFLFLFLSVFICARLTSLSGRLICVLEFAMNKLLILIISFRILFVPMFGC